MFGVLHAYLGESYYKEHPEIRFHLYKLGGTVCKVVDDFGKGKQ